MNFARLPPRALLATKRVLDDDVVFRRRVAGAVTESGVGRAGWLFLHRPDGWQEALHELAEAAADVHDERADRRAAADAERRCEAATQVAARATEALGTSRAEVARLVASLAEERQARRASAEEAAGLRSRLDAVEGARVADAASAAAARAELAVLTATVAELRNALDQAGSASNPMGDAPSGAHGADIAARLGEVSATLVETAAALRAAADELFAPPTEHGASPDVVPPARDGVTRSAGALGGPVRSPGPIGPASRVALALPPGLHDDSTEAAAHLLRAPSVIVLIDGYNVAHEGWPDRPPAEQRRRLLDVLFELAARTTARIEVVFDGADEPLWQGVTTLPRTVRVSFSPPGVEADEVLVDRARALPVDQAVLVVSSDNRVRTGAGRVGANLVFSRQFLHAAGRRGGGRPVPAVTPPR